MPGRFACFLLLLPLLAACSTNSSNSSNPSNPSNPGNPSNPNPNSDEYRPSPIPAGYAMLAAKQRNATPQYSEGGDTVDELLAVVDGEVLTRQEVTRRLRLPTAPEDRTGSEEQEIREERLKWAQQQLVIAAARRAGLRLPESSMDDIALNFLKQQIKANEEETGEKLTPEEYLSNRQLTWKEYRAQAKGDIIYQYFVEKLLRGIGQARPEIDMEVSPAEIRRIYYDHKDEFNEKAGVRYAFFSCVVEGYDDPDTDPAEAEAAAIKKAEAIKGAFERGNEAWLIAAHFKLPEEDWTESEKDEFSTRYRLPAVNEWMFEEGRKAGDATIIFDAAGPTVFGILETRPERPRALDEVYDNIKAMLSRGKEMRLSAKLVIQQLNRGSVVWPDELADELLDQSYQILDFLRTNEVLGKARLK